MSTRNCLRCGMPTIIYGSIQAGPETRANFVTRFRWNFRKGTPAAAVDAKHAECCLSCGLVWGNISPDELRDSIVKHSGELGRQYVASVLAGPFYDLPDLPEAHEAGRKVAAIDRALLAGDTSDAAVAYRDLMHSNWDEARSAVRDWAVLSRIEKLAICGWNREDVTPFLPSAFADHPLRDQLLDG